MENASDDFHQQTKLENLLPNFAGSSPPISPKTSPTSLEIAGAYRRRCLCSLGPHTARKHLTPGHSVGRPPLTHAITGQNCLCLCAFSFPEWEGRKVPTKSLFEQEAPKIGTQKCSTKRGVREAMHVQFALNNREMFNATVFEKRVFEQTTPLK